MKIKNNEEESPNQINTDDSNIFESFGWVFEISG